MGLKIAFRVDAAFGIGTGHVLRCLTLASELAKAGNEIYFISRLHPGHLCDYIEQMGYPIFRLEAPSVSWDNQNQDCEVDYSTWLGAEYEADAESTVAYCRQEKIDAIFVDHYGIDEKWESLVKKSVDKILVIDDLANRAHNCDWLIDQTYGRNYSDYEHFLPGETSVLLGGAYALLRSEFANARKTSLYRSRKSVQQILITMGGIDPDNVTSKILDWLTMSSLPDTTKIIIVLSKNAVWIDALKKQLPTNRFCVDLRLGVSNIAELMSQSDLSIGAGGTTAWERCALGLPTIQYVLAENQRFIAKTLSSRRVIIPLELTGNSAELVTAVDSSHLRLKKIQILSAAMIDGRGAARVVNNIFNRGSQDRELYLQPVNDNSSQYIYYLQSLPGVRNYFRSPDIPTLSDHERWFKRAIDDTEIAMFIVTLDDERVGMVRLDELNGSHLLISIIVDPKYAGKGIGKKCLSTLLEICPADSFKAIIHKANIASRRIFERSGFVLSDSEDGDFLVYFKEENLS